MRSGISEISHFDWQKAAWYKTDFCLSYACLLFFFAQIMHLNLLVQLKECKNFHFTVLKVELVLLHHFSLMLPRTVFRHMHSHKKSIFICHYWELSIVKCFYFDRLWHDLFDYVQLASVPITTTVCVCINHVPSGTALQRNQEWKWFWWQERNQSPLNSCDSIL